MSRADGDPDRREFLVNRGNGPEEFEGSLLYPSRP